MQTTDWVSYFLSAGLLPILLFLAVVFLVLGYSGNFGWVTIREGKRRSAVVTGYICLIVGIVTINALVFLLFGSGVAIPTAPPSLTAPSTTIFTLTNTPLATLDPLTLVLGTPTPDAQASAISAPSPTMPPSPTSLPLDASGACAEEFDPPCTYSLQGETSMFAVARSVTKNDDQAMLYAGLMRNLIRDVNGYIGPITPLVRVPNAEAPINTDYFQFYFSDYGWGVCSSPIEAPCIYQVDNGFVVADQDGAYQAIGRELFPRLSNAAKCIKEANTYVHIGGDVYKPVEIQPGVTLIIPNVFAPGRESCRN